jgi:hypothetical protein
VAAAAAVAAEASGEAATSAMPTNGRPSITKRNREQAKREKREEKAARRAERARERASQPVGQDGEDPDLAGIRPGPQPPRED